MICNSLTCCSHRLQYQRKLTKPVRTGFVGSLKTGRLNLNFLKILKKWKSEKTSDKLKKPSDKSKKPTNKPKNRPVFSFSPKFWILNFVPKTDQFLRFSQCLVKPVRTCFWSHIDIVILGCSGGEGGFSHLNLNFCFRITEYWSVMKWIGHNMAKNRKAKQKNK
jgi:hypothetical protein